MYSNESLPFILFSKLSPMLVLYVVLYSIKMSLCHLLIMFANSLGQHQVRQNAVPDLDQNCFKPILSPKQNALGRDSKTSIVSERTSHAMLVRIVMILNEYSNKPVHPHNLYRAFAVPIHTS